MTEICRYDHSGQELSIESRKKDIYDNLSVSVLQFIDPRNREKYREREREREKEGERERTH